MRKYIAVATLPISVMRPPCKALKTAKLSAGFYCHKGIHLVECTVEFFICVYQAC